ncbi:MAG: VTT domain-containing protein [Pyrinomonadaceae bacterium]
MDLFAELSNAIPHLPVGVVFVLLILGTYVSEDATCLIAGVAVANDDVALPVALAACLLGIFSGDMLLFWIGRIAGDRIFSTKVVTFFVAPAARERAGKWLRNNVASSVMLSRFVTGLRLPTYLAAGALGTETRRFAFFVLIAASISTTFFVLAAAYWQSFAYGTNALIGVAVIFVGFRLAVKLSTWRGRRRVLGRIKRLIKWEFWPVQVFYAPAVAYIVLLGIKYRSLTAFTAANPSFPAGGFKGESKHEIYRLLSQPEATESLLPYVLVRAAADPQLRLAQALQFVDENRLEFPVIVKPDVGERGRGVRAVHSIDDLQQTIANAGFDLIVQPYIPGEEVSVFYFRRPTERKGSIFSITLKQFPTVRGDGNSTIEQLVLADPRSVCMADRYFEQIRDDIYRVPAADESVRLIDIGTHSRGAVFLDGGHLLTPELEYGIDTICRSIPGFYFGRFDIRVPALDDLRRGKNLSIIELNGVTSESTNIYDPRFSLVDAYRILFRQWRLAFEIGTANISLGARPARIADLVRLAFGRPLKDGNPECASSYSHTIKPTTTR